MMQNIEFRDLLNAITTGNHHVFNSLYSSYRNEFVKYYIRKLKFTEEECADAFQEAIVILYENIRDGKLTEMTSTVKTYLFSIGKFKLLNILKKSQHHSNFCSYQLINGERNVLNGMEKKSDDEYLIKLAQDLLSQLNNEERALLEQFYLNEKSLKDIAFELGITESAARKRKFDILKRLSSKIRGKLLIFTGIMI
jgi:RNA polymerase sigma factor (sigma-70 family)